MFELAQEEEPDDNGTHTITNEQFLKLLRNMFPNVKKTHVLAVLKRCISFVWGKKALYLRLPSADESQAIFQITIDNVHLEVLADHDKPFYGKYKRDIYEYPPDFEQNVEREQSMIKDRMERCQSFPDIKDYIAECSNSIQSKLNDAAGVWQPVTTTPPQGPHAPDSPDSGRQVAPIGSDGSWLLPSAPCGSGATRRSTFQIPGRRRLRQKTSESAIDEP